MSADAETIFHRAMELGDAERNAFLDEVCATAPEVRIEVESLLRGYARGAYLESFLPEQHASDPELLDTEKAGAVIDRYHLIEQIGEGGMGIVYMAEQRHPVRRMVALKIIKPGMDSRQVISRFQAERQALALMNHPHIARVLDAGATKSGSPYFVMELVRGISITTFCDENQFDVNQRLELFIKVCDAIQHAHQKGVIHRDLKPSNILVELADVRPIPKVIDFGVAKAVDQSLGEHSHHTGFLQMVGTPLYMSPEQAQLNSLDVDTRSDIYSLGVLLYELLTGTTPFEKETFRKAGFDEMRRLIREQEPLRPSARVTTMEAKALSTVADRRRADVRRLGSVLRGELDWIVMKSLEKDRTRRYETASALANDVQRYLNKEAVLACPPSAWYRTQKLFQRHRGSIIAAGLVALSLLIGSAVSLWYAVEARRASHLAEQRRQDVERTNNELTDKTQRLAEQNQEIAAAEATANSNFELAKRAVAHLVQRVARQQLAGAPQLGPLRSDMLTTARDFYSELIITSPDDPSLYKLRAYVRMLLLDDRGAMEDYRRALELDPADSESHLELGYLYCYSKDPKLVDAARGRQHQRLGLQVKAQRAFERGFRPSAELSDDLHYESYLLEERPDWKLLRKAEWLGYIKGDPAAIKAYDEALAATSDANVRAAALCGRASLLAGLGRREEAIQDLTRAMQSDAFAHQLYQLRGDIYHQSGKTELALQDWERAMELSGQSEFLRRPMAKACFSLGRYGDALAHLQRYADNNPDEVSALLWIPVWQVATCPDAEFVLGYRRLADRYVQRNQASYQCLAVRCALSIELDDREAALRDLHELVAQNVVSGESEPHPILLALKLDEPAVARQICDGALRTALSAKNADQASATAWTLIVAPSLLADYAPLLDLVRQRAKPRPQDSWLHLVLAATCYRSGDYTEAAKELALAEQATNNAKTNALYLYFQALTRFQLGHTSDAERWLARAQAERAAELNGEKVVGWNRRTSLDLLNGEAQRLIMRLEQNERAPPTDSP